MFDRKVRPICKKGAALRPEVRNHRTPPWLDSLRVRFACRQQIEDMMLFADTHEEYLRCACLFLLSYVFLLRLPSEALPAVAGKRPGQKPQSMLELHGEELRLTLRKRKNKPQGSVLVRKCWCHESARTCPVHVLGPIVVAAAPGSPLFGGLTAAKASHTLKLMLKEIGVAGAERFRTHDMRRGHARDLQLSGTPFSAGM